jgi:hypothetical protein
VDHPEFGRGGMDRSTPIAMTLVEKTVLVIGAPPRRRHPHGLCRIKPTFLAFSARQADYCWVCVRSAPPCTETPTTMVETKTSADRSTISMISDS